MALVKVVTLPEPCAFFTPGLRTRRFLKLCTVTPLTPLMSIYVSECTELEDVFNKQNSYYASSDFSKSYGILATLCAIIDHTNVSILTALNVVHQTEEVTTLVHTVGKDNQTISPCSGKYCRECEILGNNCGFTCTCPRCPAARCSY